MNNFPCAVFLLAIIAGSMHAVETSGIYVSESGRDFRQALSLRNRDGKCLYVYSSVSDVVDPAVLNGNECRGMALIVGDRVYFAVTTVRADSRGVIVPFSQVVAWRLVERDKVVYLIDEAAAGLYESNGVIPASGTMRKVADGEPFGVDLRSYLSPAAPKK
jgi:hypothetical protein